MDTMDQNPENGYLCKKYANIKDATKEVNNAKKSNKCNQCDFASSWAQSLKTHLKIHNGEKLNKCNQCDYISAQAGHLRIHLKTHGGEKTN